MVVTGYQLKTVRAYWRARHAAAAARGFIDVADEARGRCADLAHALAEYRTVVCVRPDRERPDRTLSLVEAATFLKLLRIERSFNAREDFDLPVALATRIAHATGAIKDGYTVKIEIDVDLETKEPS